MQDILRDFLKDIKGISLNESKLSISYTCTILKLATYSRKGRVKLALYYPSRARVILKLK